MLLPHRQFSLLRDLLSSLMHTARFGSQFIHPDLPASSLSRTGSGRGVEGFTSGRPDPRPAMRAMNNTMPLYKYIPTHRPCCTIHLSHKPAFAISVFGGANGNKPNHGAGIAFFSMLTNLLCSSTLLLCILRHAHTTYTEAHRQRTP